MNEQLNTYRTPKILSVAASGLILAAACGSAEGDHHDDSAQNSYEAHFSVECADGIPPSIVTAETSGTLPYDPEFDGHKTGNFVEKWGADAYVGLTCIDSDGQNSLPTIKMDHRNGGECLGYEDGQYHLVFEVQAEDKNPVHFFDREDDTVEYIARVGAVNNGGPLTIKEASIHHHNLDNEPVARRYEDSNC